MDIETNISHRPKSSLKHHQYHHNSQSSAAKPNALTSLHATANALRAKQLAEKQHHQRTNEKRCSSGNTASGKLVHGSKDRIERLHLPDDMNNSCSNITASTYLNGNEISGTSVGLELGHDGNGGGNAVVNADRKYSGGISVDRESMYSGISNDRMSHRSHDMISENGGNLLSLRRESSSTYERDMDIIDLLERERSVLDMQDVIECERQRNSIVGDVDQRKFPTKKVAAHMAARPSVSGGGGSGGERRKLPDITKITTSSKLPAATMAPLSPKQRLISIGSTGGGGGVGGSGNIDHQQHHQSTNFPNFVFTHQYNEFAEARINRNRDVNGVVVSSNPNTNSSTAVGANANANTAAVLMGRSRNNSQTSFSGGGGGSKRNSDAYAWNDDDVGVNRVTRARSIDSRKSSTKSNHSDMVRGATATTTTTAGGGSVLSNNYMSSAYASNL